mgnify:CR=1 FL=1
MTIKTFLPTSAFLLLTFDFLNYTAFLSLVESVIFRLGLTLLCIVDLALSVLILFKVTQTASTALRKTTAFQSGCGPLHHVIGHCFSHVVLLVLVVVISEGGRRLPARRSFGGADDVLTLVAGRRA